MPSNPLQIEDIFHEALRHKPGVERDGYLEQACGEDTDLRQRVERLLNAAKDAGSFLESPATDLSPTAYQPIAERPGDHIGPYKLLQQIGEGGMGVVYMAEQSEPIERRVALKIIKPGMDTRQVIARFEAERQALAMMDHPNIARAIEAGMTDSGRPYFIMELVKGVPITDYCDEHQLTPHERLELFVPVCQAIQHAHQKGIIHRDIKPSNVLVADYDDHPVPKVIDFGVAKAIDHRLTEKTMFTEFGQVLGTFEYMSPEQAKLNQWDVDTRTDIYSLGVLLYELLSGETPFDRQRLRSAAFDELLRIIREEEPPRPSTRLGTSQSLPTIAARRKTEPKKLGAVIHGELDWIVMKALEKDRTRRYETASKFAEDVAHYLNNETVEACPPSAAYRFRKFARRNKPLLATLAAVASALLVGTAIATWQAVRAIQERNRAVAAEAAAGGAAERADKEAERANREAKKAQDEAEIAQAVNDFLNKDLLAQANPFQLPKQDVKLREVLDLASEKVEGKFDDQPLVEAAIHQTLADTYKSIGEYEQAERHSRLSMEIRLRVLGEGDLATLESMRSYADALYRLGRRAESEHMARKVLALSIRELGPENELLADIHNQIAIALHRQGLLEEAREHYRKSIEFSEKINKTRDFQTMTNLGIATEKKEEKVELLREALKVGKDKLGEGHILLADTMYWLAVALGTESDEAIALHREVLDMRMRVLGPRHPHTILSRSYLALAAGRRLRNVGDLEEAVDKFTEAIHLKPYGMHFYYEDRGRVYAQLEEWEKAIADYDRAIAEWKASRPWISVLRAAAYVQLEEWDKAAADLLVSIEHEPHDGIAWLRLAPVLVLSGNEAAYENYCHRLINTYEDAPYTSFADIVCKCCLLRSGVVEIDRLPVGVLDEALAGDTANPSHIPWYWSAKALVAYRSGSPDLALTFTEKAEKSDRFSERPAQALYLVVRAMSEADLKQTEHARETLSEVAAIIAELKESQEYREGHPLLRDLLIARILYAETEALLSLNEVNKDREGSSTDDGSLEVVKRAATD